MLYSVKAPDGNIITVNGPPGASQAEVIAQAKRLYAAQKQQTQAAAQPKAKELAGFSGAFMDAASTLGLADEASAFVANPTKANREKLLAAGESKYKTVGFGEGQNWEAFKELVGGSLGFVAAPLSIGAATGIASLGAAAPYTAGSALYSEYAIQAAQRAAQRQHDQEAAGQTVDDVSRAKILGAAAGETALDVLELKWFKALGKALPLGKGAAGKVSKALDKLGPEDKVGAIASAIKDGTYSFKNQMFRGVAHGMVFEIPQEVAQQALERYGAGLSLTSPDALQEYGQAALGAGLLGGPMGAINRGLEISKAKTLASGNAQPNQTGFSYRAAVDSLVRDGIPLASAEKIATIAERKAQTLGLTPDAAVSAARIEWERANARSQPAPPNVGANPATNNGGAGAGVPVPSAPSGQTAATQQPAPTPPVGLVPPNASAAPAGGGEERVPTPLEQKPVAPTPVPTPSVEPAAPEPVVTAPPPAPAPVTPEGKPAEPVATTPPPAPAPVTPEVKPAEPVVTPKKPTLTLKKPKAVVTPEVKPAEPVAAVAPEVKPAEPVAAVAPEATPEETPIAALAPADKPATERVVKPTQVPGAAELREKVEQAYDDDALDDDQYKESILALSKGKGLPNKILKLIGAQETPAVTPTTTPSEAVKEAEAAPSTQEDAYTPNERDLTADEFALADKLLSQDKPLPPELLSALGVDPRHIPVTKIDQNTGKVVPDVLSQQQSVVLMRDRLEALRKFLPKVKYKNIAHMINSGQALPEDTLELLGLSGKGESPHAPRTRFLTEAVEAKKSKQFGAASARDREILTGSKYQNANQLAQARATYTGNVLRAVAQLFDRGKITPAERTVLINEATKEEPNRKAINSLIVKYRGRKGKVKLPLMTDEDATVAKILARINKPKEAAPKASASTLGAKEKEAAAPPVTTGGDQQTKKRILDVLRDTFNKVNQQYPDVTYRRAILTGTDKAHPAWATNALKSAAGGPNLRSAHIFYSNDTDGFALYRGMYPASDNYLGTGVIFKSPIADMGQAGELLYAAELDDLIPAIHSGIPLYVDDRGDGVIAITDFDTGEPFTFSPSPGVLRHAQAIASVYDSIDDHAVSYTGSEDGPFTGKSGQVVKTESVDQRYADLLAGLLQKLNLSDLRIMLFNPDDIRGDNAYAYKLVGDGYKYVPHVLGDHALGVKVSGGERITSALTGKRVGRDMFIGLRPGMSERLTIEVLAHELGHVIEDVALHNASSTTIQAIKLAHEEWFFKSHSMSGHKVIASLKSYGSAAEFIRALPDTPAGKHIQGSMEFDKYLRSFEEWWADNVARWVTTDAKPLSVVDKFFAKIAEVLRKLMQTISGKQFLPNAKVAEFLNSMTEGRRDYIKDFLSGRTEMDVTDWSSTGGGYDYSDAAIRPSYSTTGKPRPEVNSTGRNIHVTDRGRASFWNWFGDSKTVDEQGRPIVYYHGTQANITAFREGRFTPGIFVSPDADIASGFAGEAGEANVIPLYVKADKPFDYDNEDHVNDLIESMARDELQIAAGIGSDMFDDQGVTSYEGEDKEAIVANVRQKLKNGEWRVIEDQSVQDALRWLGYDGFYVQEFGKKNLAVYDPAQLKSAIGNIGTFDKSDIRIDHSALPTNVASAMVDVSEANAKIAEVQEKIRNSTDATEQVEALGEAVRARDPSKLREAADIYVDGLSGGTLNTALTTMPTSWVIEKVEKQLPSLRHAATLMDLLGGATDKMHRAFSKLGSRIGEFINTNGGKELNETIMWARLLQVSAGGWDANTTLAAALEADDEIQAYTTALAGETDAAKRAALVHKIENRKVLVSHVYEVWNTLGKQKGGQELYHEIMNFYKEAHTTVQGLLIKDIESMSELTPEERKALIGEAQEAFDITNHGEVDEKGIFRRTAVESYFPWRRYGDHWLRFFPPNDGKEEFYQVSSATKLEALKRKLAAKHGVPYEGDQAARYFEHGDDIETLRASIIRNNMSPILQRMFKVLDKAQGARNISTERIKDDLVQMWLLTLPERSIRRQFLHSADVTGMSTDIQRVFNDTASVYANQIAKLQYGNKIRTQIDAARQAIEPDREAEGNLDPKERARLESYIEVVARRAEEVITPPERNQLISTANHLAHFWYLSSPSHALRNMISIPMRTIPKLNGLYGYANTFTTTMRYLNAFNSVKFTENGKLVEPSMEGSAMLEANPALKDMFYMGRDRLAFSGLGKEITRHDMPSDATGKRVLDAVYSAGTAVFNASERLSREVSFMMQAELAYKKYIKEDKSDAEAKRLAVEDAVQGVKSAIGDFSEFERPDFMRTTGKLGDLSRAVFMFKMWGIAQTKFFITYADKVLRGKGLTSAERRAAFHELSGVLGMAVLFGGAFGLPAMGALFSIIDMLEKALFGDDDDDTKRRRATNPLLADSSEARFKYEWLPKHFGGITVPNISGKQVSLAQIIAQGPVSAFSGVDLASKTSYDNLWFNSPGYSATYVDAVANFLRNNMGPDVSIGVNVLEAADSLSKGQIMRAVSNLVPAIAKGPVAAYRLATEGTVTSKGVPIVNKGDISMFAKAAAAVGFSPTVAADAYERKTLIEQELKRMETEKANIKSKFLQAIINKRDMRGVLDAVQEFNKRYPQPEFAITVDQLLTTMSGYEKSYTTSIFGAAMPKTDDWMYAPWYVRNRYK